MKSSRMLLMCHTKYQTINEIPKKLIHDIYLLLRDVLLRSLVDDIHPTNTGMLDSDVDLIILLGLGVMYDFDLILS